MTVLLCSSRIWSAVQLHRASIQRVRAFTKSSETESRSNNHTILMPFKRLAAGFTHQLRQPIYFVACIRPKRDARTIRPMVLVLCEPKKFRRLIATRSIKGVIIFSRTFMNQSELRQEL